MHVHLLGVQGLNFRNQIEPQESSVRQVTLAARTLSEHIARRTAFSRAGPERLCTLLVIGVLLTVPANALDPQKLITQFTHTSWTAKDGIPGPVRAIAQTPDGYLWLGTEVGLYRFDGLRFVAWEPSFGERIPSSSVWSLYTARDGSLWIGFSSAGIGQLHNGHLTTYSQSDDVPPGGILSIVEDGSGSIWAGGPYGLRRVLARWSRYDLIAIDEVGYVPLAEVGAEFLFQVVAERAEKAAVVLTTNLPFSEWTQVIPNARLCKALLDRITDRAHILETGTESYRFRRTAEKQKKGAKTQ
jgi:hypothetical protein